MSGVPADFDERMRRMEELVQTLANTVLNNNQPAPTPAAPAPVEGPGLFTGATTDSKLVLRPNPPFIFDGDRSQGWSFLHAVKTFIR